MSLPARPTSWWWMTKHTLGLSMPIRKAMVTLQPSSSIHHCCIFKRSLLETNKTHTTNEARLNQLILVIFPLLKLAWFNPVGEGEGGWAGGKLPPPPPKKTSQLSPFMWHAVVIKKQTFKLIGAPHNLRKLNCSLYCVSSHLKFKIVCPFPSPK